MCPRLQTEKGLKAESKYVENLDTGNFHADTHFRGESTYYLSCEVALCTKVSICASTICNKSLCIQCLLYVPEMFLLLPSFCEGNIFVLFVLEPEYFCIFSGMRDKISAHIHKFFIAMQVNQAKSTFGQLCTAMISAAYQNICWYNCRNK